MPHYEDDEFEPLESEPSKVELTENGAITITVPRLSITEDEIVRGVCRHFADKLTPVIEKELKALADQAFDAAMQKAADEMLRELLSRPQRKTNQWGESVGEPVTMREYIADRFEQYMKVSVDREGRPSSYDSDRKRTRSQWLIETLGEKLVLDAAKVEVEKVRKSAESQIAAAVANFIASKLSGPATAPLLPDGM